MATAGELIPQGGINILPLLCGLVAGLASLKETDLQNIEINSTEKELDTINDAVSETRNLLRKILQFSTSLKEHCKVKVTKAAEWQRLVDESKSLSEQCVAVAEGLSKSAGIADRRSIPTFRAFFVRCRWSILVLGAGLALHFTPLFAIGTTVSALAIGGMVGGAVAVGSTLIATAVASINEERAKMIDEAESLENLSTKLRHIEGNINTIMTTCTSAAVVISEQDYESMEIYADSMIKTANEALTKAQTIKVFVKNNQWPCVIA